MRLQAVILAAGRGSRLHPITHNRSKAMLPVVGKPMVARVIETLTTNEITDFILVINPKDNDIIDYFSRNSHQPAKVRFVHQSTPLGMAHALRCAAPFITENFILSACDNLVTDTHIAHLISRWQNNPNLSAILSLLRIESMQQAKSTSIVEMDGQWITRIIEKPSSDPIFKNVCSLPLYIFSRHILDYLEHVSISPRGEFELQDAIQLIIDRSNQVLGMMTDFRLTLTAPIDLLTINRHYLSKHQTLAHPESCTIGKNSQLRPPIYIEPQTTIGAETVIGPNVYVEHNCHIGHQVKIQESVILKGTMIPDHSVINHQVVY